MALYQHTPGCPELVGGLCICEPARYAGSGAIAIGIAMLLFVAASFAGSKALIADGWHLIGDGAFDVFTLGIAVVVGRYRSYERLYRRCGAFVQTLLLAGAAGLVLVELSRESAPAASGWLIALMGAVDTTAALIRFRVLHAGSPIRALGEIVRALARGQHEENITFVAELVHVGSDLGVGPITMIAGGVVALGFPAADHLAAWMIFFILLLGAAVTARFAGTHKHMH